MYADIEISRQSAPYDRMVINVNGYWVTVRNKANNRVVFKRSADSGPWCDAPHAKIIEAIQAIEKALNDIPLEL